jgi:hypothetical protein
VGGFARKRSLRLKNIVYDVNFFYSGDYYTGIERNAGRLKTRRPSAAFSEDAHGARIRDG